MKPDPFEPPYPPHPRGVLGIHSNKRKNNFPPPAGFEQVWAQLPLTEAF